VHSSLASFLSDIILTFASGLVTTVVTTFSAKVPYTAHGLATSAGGICIMMHWCEKVLSRCRQRHCGLR